MLLSWCKTKTRKKVLGFFTLWPLIYPLIFFSFLIIILCAIKFSGILSGQQNFYIIFIIVPIIIIIPIHFLTVLCILVFKIIYLLDVLTNEKLQGIPKVLWAIAVSLSGQLANVFYWYFYIWQDPPLSMGKFPKLSKLFGDQQQMTLGKKINLGIATILPLFIFFMTMILFFSFFIYMVLKGQNIPKNTFPSDFIIFFLGFFCFMLIDFFLIIFLLIFYLFNIFNNEKVKPEKKALWIPILSLGAIFTMPFYWYFYIWKEPETLIPIPVSQA